MQRTDTIWIFIGTVSMLVLTLLMFVGSVEAAWYDSNYGYCRKLTMTAGAASGVATTTTTGFPLVATSTISTLAATSSAGRIEKVSNDTPVDVVLVAGTDCNSDSGAVLDYYFESYASTTGEFTLWVQANDISSTTAKTVLMYYGNASASNLSDENGVWDAQGEAGIWNLREDPTGVVDIVDSTATAEHGVDNGGMDSNDQVQGKVNGSLDFDGSNDYISMDDIAAHSGFSAITVAYWVNWTSFGDSNDQRFIVAKSNWSSQREWRTRVENNTDFVWQVSNDGNDPGSNEIRYAVTNFTAGQWHHIAVTYDDANSDLLELYVDGVRVATGTGDTGGMVDGTAGVVIGSSSDNGGGAGGAEDNHSGKIDDVRIYNEALTEADILTIYNNTVNSSLFWTFGSEETESVAAVTKKVRLRGVRLRGVRLR